jgi:hypothetical protein
MCGAERGAAGPSKTGNDGARCIIETQSGVRGDSKPAKTRQLMLSAIYVIIGRRFSFHEIARTTIRALTYREGCQHACQHTMLSFVSVASNPPSPLTRVQPSLMTYTSTSQFCGSSTRKTTTTKTVQSTTHKHEGNNDTSVLNIP